MWDELSAFVTGISATMKASPDIWALIRAARGNGDLTFHLRDYELLPDAEFHVKPRLSVRSGERE